jgi:hypothetical protein
MAITTETFKINSGWGRTDIIQQIDDALVWLDWHGGEQSGMVVGLGTYTGGGDTNASDEYHDVFPKSTTGIGTGASFYVYRDTLGVRRIHVNRPGFGYTSGEVVTLDADSIGGFSNGATDLSFSVCVNEVVINGANISIALTEFNSGSNGMYWFEGTDRTGAIGAGATIITIREGDTLNLDLQSGAGTYGYYACIANPTPYDTTAPGANSSRIAGWPVTGVAGTISWTPKPGQAGTYFFRSAYTNYRAELGRLVVLPWSGDPGDRTVVGFGTSSTFWQKNLSNATQPWGVARRTIQENKLFGDTYTLFKSYSSSAYTITTGSGYMPFGQGSDYDTTNTENCHGSTGWWQRFAGAKYLDYGSYTLDDIYDSDFNVDSDEYGTQRNSVATIGHGSNTSFDLDLNLYRSGLDPRFAVFSYRYPTLSSTSIDDNNEATFILHNFTTDTWDYDHVFLGGLTRIFTPDTGDSDRYIHFRTYLCPWDPDNNWGPAKRSAEWGYHPYAGYTSAYSNWVDWYVHSRVYPDDFENDHAHLYSRLSEMSSHSAGGSGDSSGKDRVSPEANFNAVVKGLPLNGNLVPMPYYIPDDFVIIQFYYNAANANIQQGDTITVSPSEVYKVITGSYSQTSVTRGVLFCARVV